MVIHNHVIDLLPAYALDCLDEEEFITVSEHLAVCEQCRTELQSFQAVADQLVLIAPEATPSSGLKNRLMTQVQSKKIRSVWQKAPRSVWWKPLTALIHRSAPIWGLASLLLAVVLGTSTWMLWQQTQPTMETHSPMDAFEVVRLHCTQAAPNATGQIMISKDGQFATLLAGGLPIPAPGTKYQLWLIQDGQRVSGGMFSVTLEGYGSMSISAPESLLEYSSFDVTMEPVAGSIEPTGEIVLEARLSAH
ncbi:MAG: hypothetical protein GY801_37065 [bacterium]|nr:hypothetical protein [bacterium]